jgi:hypothetical protein
MREAKSFKKLPLFPKIGKRFSWDWKRRRIENGSGNMSY